VKKKCVESFFLVWYYGDNSRKYIKKTNEKEKNENVN